jgi:hypothetical protein
MWLIRPNYVISSDQIVDGEPENRNFHRGKSQPLHKRMREQLNEQSDEMKHDTMYLPGPENFAEKFANLMIFQNYSAPSTQIWNWRKNQPGKTGPVL